MAIFQTQIEIFSFALEFLSVHFFILKEILVGHLLPSSEISSYYENNPQVLFNVNVVLLHACIFFVWTLTLHIERRCSKSMFN